jgi:hypothetical protein
MKKIFFIILITLSFQLLYSQSDVRQRININREWKFKLGDYPGAEAVSFKDTGWNNINLPHNFSIPFFNSARWYTGYGWYRKYIDIPADWNGKRVSVEFEGAFREAEVFVNGKPVGQHQSGYTGFSVDITDAVIKGSNVLAVRLNNNWNPRLAPRDGDHNFTGGIYRDVYLVVTNPVHVTWYGTFVTTPDLSKSSGKVNIKTEVRNDGATAKSYKLKTDIVDPSGKVVSSVSSALNIAANATATFDQTTETIKTPKLWHPQHPIMYKAVSNIFDGKKVIDIFETPFGFRWIKWTSDSGFFINGEHYYFKGADVHQDHAGWASAVTNAAIIRDVRMIKDCGMDFIRGSHYPHDPSFSDACDTLGILLWQENNFWGCGGAVKDNTGSWFIRGGSYPVQPEYQKDFEESVKTSLREMIRIHRNHPSIIVWSMCNEPYFADKSVMPRVRSFLKELTQLSHELDPTRLVAIGGCQRGGIDKCGDIAGYNGDGARIYMNPGIPSVVSEYGSTVSIRPGKYEPGFGDVQKEQFTWRSGQTLWCAFDYGTHAGKFGLMGMIDYFRLPKNMWYWYRNEYKHIAPPEAAKEGIPAKLKLTANKTTIGNTDGTDDVQLIVTVLDIDGSAISNSPDVTLTLVSGPGEFPTGSSITFSNTSDIYIRDGKAAIEFRSYYGGKSVIKATSPGLQDALITIETKGTPGYVEGKTLKVEERPFIPYVTKIFTQVSTSKVNLAPQKPTRASSEAHGFNASLANDQDVATCWQAKAFETNNWWQVDLENLYKISKIKVSFPSDGNYRYKVEISDDATSWEMVSDQTQTTSTEKTRTHSVDEGANGRFLRITFIGLPNGKPAALAEVEVFGKTIQ